MPISDKVVFASRLQVGNLRPVNDEPANVPFSKKFFLGGATNLRGWGRFGSAAERFRAANWGEQPVVVLRELRMDLRGKLGAVVFLDGATCGPNRGA